MSEPESKGSRMTSVLGDKALVLGNVEGRGDLEIRGRVQGDVVLEGRCSVAEQGTVLGRLEAVQLMVAGTVRGDLLATELISISASAVVEGNVEAPRVEMEAGATVRGQLRTGLGRDALAEARSPAVVPTRAGPPAVVPGPPLAARAEPSFIPRPTPAVSSDTSGLAEGLALQESPLDADEEPSRPRRRKRRRRSSARDGELGERDGGSESLLPPAARDAQAAALAPTRGNQAASSQAASNQAASSQAASNQAASNQAASSHPLPAGARVEHGTSGRQAPAPAGTRRAPRGRLGEDGETAPEVVPRPEREPRRPGGKGPSLPTFVKGARGHLRQ